LTNGSIGERHRIENRFARLKSFRRISTRYEKPHAYFAAIRSIDFILISLK
jgi:transposase